MLVHWLDAVGPADLDVGEELAIGEAHTLGRVRSVSDEKLVVAGEWFDDGTQRAVTAIPRISITGVEVLREC